MIEKNNAVCSICGKSYYKCLSCKDLIKLQPWKSVTDTAECYKVFQVVKGFSTGLYNKNEFKSRLKNIDLNDLENYREHIKALIKDALKEDEPVVEKIIAPRKRNYKVDREIVDEVKVDEVIEVE